MKTQYGKIGLSPLGRQSQANGLETKVMMDSGRLTGESAACVQYSSRAQCLLRCNRKGRAAREMARRDAMPGPCKNYLEKPPSSATSCANTLGLPARTSPLYR